MSAAEQFEIVDRSNGKVWAHKTLPIWVCYYSMPFGDRAFYQAYIATGELIAGQHPCMGRVDNKWVGSDDGFETIETACRAAITKATGEAS